VLPGPAYVDATPVPADVSAEPWDAAAARWRLDRLRDALPMAVPADAAFSGGASNDVWITGDVVLRVCWRGDRGRLLRDAAVVSALPAAVPHAPVLDSGRTNDLSWMLAERVSGRPLDVVAAELPRAPAQLQTSLHERLAMDPGDPLSVWASDLMPLPVDRALSMIDLACSIPFVDPALLDATRARLEELAPFDPFADPAESSSVVHTDATPGNILVHNGKIRALLDFEWVRWGPCDHELVSLVRMVQHGSGPGFSFLRWLEEDYPALFEHPDLDDRLWPSEIAHILHGVIWWPPDQPEATLDPEHHLHALRRLVEAPWPRR